MNHPPLKKEFYESKEEVFLDDYSKKTTIPILPHKGAFGAERKWHMHEGIDLYTNPNDEVFSMEDGEIVKIELFTGGLDSPWWNETHCVMVSGKSGIINYGEITPQPNLKVGQKISAGDLIGQVKTVLKKNKGRPMTMLHLELLSSPEFAEWKVGQKKPDFLLDPTILLLPFTKKDN